MRARAHTHTHTHTHRTINRLTQRPTVWEKSDRERGLRAKEERPLLLSKQEKHGKQGKLGPLRSSLAHIKE